MKSTSKIHQSSNEKSPSSLTESQNVQLMQLLDVLDKLDLGQLLTNVSFSSASSINKQQTLASYDRIYELARAIRALNVKVI